MCQFPLFETLCIIDGDVQNIEYHQKRVEQSCLLYFYEKVSFNLSEILSVPDEFKTGKVRCRIDYNPTKFTIAFFHYHRKKIENYLVVDVENLDYQFKYADRKRLDNLKNSQYDEVIVINNGFVSDCTIGNLLFLKAGKWYSPKHYLLKGTQLSFLLAQQKVELVEIKKNDVKSYEKVMLINAMNPFDELRAIPISQISGIEIEKLEKNT